jgi:hypothetical protein
MGSPASHLAKRCKSREPTRGFEPRTPSLRGLIRCRRRTHGVARSRLSPKNVARRRWRPKTLRRQRRRPCVDPYRTAALVSPGRRSVRPLRGPESATDEASSDLLTGAAGGQSTCRRRPSTSVEPRTAGRPRCHSPPRLAPQPGWGGDNGVDSAARLSVRPTCQLTATSASRSTGPGSACSATSSG